MTHPFPLLPFPVSAMHRLISKSMRAIAARAVAILVFASIAGCAGRTPQVDNPVLGAAPPRKPEAVALAQAEPPKKSDVVSVSYESAAGNGDEWAEKVGMVDGIPVFARDVLEADRPKLERLKAQAPPELYKSQRDQLLMMRLPQYIEQRLLLTAVREEMTGEQMTAVEEQLDRLFQEEIERLKQLAKVNTVAELEEVLDRQGTTLAHVRQVFFDREMSRQYLGLKLSKLEKPQRSDLLEEYRQREEQYRQPADVKWQQLLISFEERGGKSDAFAVLQQAVADIKAGTPFDVVVGRYSDGPMKSEGGLWDYTTRGNLASKDVEDALFSLPVGEVSRPYDTGAAYVIVRVADRREDRLTPFNDVQDTLLRELAQKRQSDAAVEVISELWVGAKIETRFDGMPQWQEMISKRYGTAKSADL